MQKRAGSRVMPGVKIQMPTWLFIMFAALILVLGMIFGQLQAIERRLVPIVVVDTIMVLVDTTWTEPNEVQ